VGDVGILVKRETSCGCFLRHQHGLQRCERVGRGGKSPWPRKEMWATIFNLDSVGILVRSKFAMASMHYGTPSSLPSDYALLSRYAHANTDNTDKDEAPDDFYDPFEPNDTQDDVIFNRPTIRRTSFPSPFLKPLQPKLPEPFASNVSVPDEYTPLLVPRIVEEVGAATDSINPQSTIRAYRDEFWILLKYTLPVFGYALPLRSVP
jgi:hypothetical protein